MIWIIIKQLALNVLTIFLFKIIDWSLKQFTKVNKYESEEVGKLGRKSISDVRKPEILEHVYAVIKEEGLQGTTLSKIAEHMGVNSSLLIHYFKTKDDIMLALTEAII